MARRVMRGKLGFAMICTAGGLWLAPLAAADPFYLRYDANVLPEEDGWTRFAVHDYENSIRTVEGGIFTLDTRASLEIGDLYELWSPNIAPDPGEVLRVSWRMRTVESLEAFPYTDVALGINAFDHTFVSFYIAPDYVIENEYLYGATDLITHIDPSRAHDYTLVSENLSYYVLFIDGSPAITGHFHGYGWPDTSRVVFGDSIVGLSSLSEWDYVEVAVVAEPSAMTLAAAGCVLLRRKARARGLCGNL